MFFHTLTFAGSRGSCLNKRLIGRVFKHLQRNPESINSMKQTCEMVIIPPQTLFVGGILFSRCPSVRPSVRVSVRPSVTFCFLNNSKSHCWIFIKPCKHVHICKTNTLDKKVRARGQFY